MRRRETFVEEVIKEIFDSVDAIGNDEVTPGGRLYKIPQFEMDESIN
jgi:hypothetical protein